MKNLAVVMGIVAGLAAGQNIGAPVNALFGSNNNLNPTTQEIAVSADGSWVAVTASLGTAADVVIVDLDPVGNAVLITNVLFPSNNDVSATNNRLVASRKGNFLCCYGSSGTIGDLVFITKNAFGNWVATNVLFPSSNNVPGVTTKPVISDDEEFIVCRGLTAIADVVIVPVNIVAGIYVPGTPFNEIIPGGNGIPLSAVDPVIAPNSLSFAVTTTNAAIGDLVIGTVAKPVTAANTTLVNVLFPGANNLLSVNVPAAASPMSNYYATHGLGTVGDLVVVAMNASGVPGLVTNVLFPASNNTANTGMPPAISGDGRLVAVNGSDTTNGDVVLVPINAAGTPGAPANVAFPSSNNLPNNQLPPVIASDAALVLQRGSATIGDLVAMHVTFTSPTVISGTTQNILYPSSNNLPDVNAHIALAPDRSYAATLGSATIGDLVITPFNASVVGQTPINVLYPSGNNVANVGTTPRISREGLMILTSGQTTVGDAVVTGVSVNQTTGLVQVAFTTNVLYANSNDNSPSTREPVFSPTTQFFVSAGVATIGDLVFVPLFDPFARFLAPADVGMSIPVRFVSPADANRTIIAGAAFGRHPGIMLSAPDNRFVPLNLDPLLILSTDPLNTVFVGFTGVLGTNGVLDGPVINLPPLVSLEGLFFHVAFVVLDPTAPIGIGTISKPAVFQIE